MFYNPVCGMHSLWGDLVARGVMAMAVNVKRVRSFTKAVTSCSLWRGRDTAS